jgi:hypothetical protein
MKKLICIFVLGLLWGGNAFSDIYKAKAFNCKYYHSAIGEIKKNKYKVYSAKENNFGFNIVNINLDTGKSQMVGNMGTDNLTTINAAPSGVHFVQMMPVGNMTMTTIYPEEVGINRMGQKLYSSSHSRHIAMVNKSLPQQFYGQCAKME